MKTISLNGKWTVSCKRREIEIPASVPGDVYRDLLKARVILDLGQTHRPVQLALELVSLHGSQGEPMEILRALHHEVPDQLTNMVRRLEPPEYREHVTRLVAEATER